jgi:hypothetical protein
MVWLIATPGPLVRDLRLSLRLGGRKGEVRERGGEDGMTHNSLWWEEERFWGRESCKTFSSQKV